MKWQEMWSRILATRYTSALEAEVARLRGENRALLNSILGIAGVPPIVVAADDPAARIATRLGATGAATSAPAQKPAPGVGGNPRTVAAVPSSTSTGSGAPGANASTASATLRASRGTKGVATPVRRRSWHQIYRMLELNAARKKENA
ncbi:MAG: hypothetical protein WA192_16835 [Candidatus Acidiferrales bacterium]